MVIDWFESNRLFKARNYDQLAKCCEAGGVGESGPQDPLTHINFFFGWGEVINPVYWPKNVIYTSIDQLKS